MRKRIASSLAALLCIFALAACTGTTFTSTPTGGSAELNDLNETVENVFEMDITDVVVEVELEEGTVDIEVVDAYVPPEGDANTDYVPLDTVYEGTGLTSGDRGTFSTSEGDFVLRVTGHGATGTITFSEA